MAARNYAPNQWKDYLFVILAAAMWGTNGVAAKYPFNHGLSPSMLVQMRSALAFLILFTILALFKKKLIRLSKKDIPIMLTFAIAGMAMVSFMFFYAILALSFLGCFLMVGGYNLELLRLNTVGLVYSFTAALLFALYTLYGEWGLKWYSPLGPWWFTPLALAPSFGSSLSPLGRSRSEASP